MTTKTGVRERDISLDAAKGFAVIAMIVVHLVPFEGGEAALEHAVTSVSAFLFDKPAPLFCMVSGMALVLADAAPRALLVRAGSLFVFGMVFRLTVFPSEILSPLALLMLLGYPLRRAPATLLFGATLAILAILPLARWGLIAVATDDWLEDGSHVADTAHGWVTLRYYLFDGNYSLLPWFAFTLLGLAFARTEWREAGRARRWFGGCLAALLALEVYRPWSDAKWEDSELSDHFAVLWEPMPTIPFVLVGCASAVFMVTACIATKPLLGRFPGWRIVVQLGRASLTHYVLHIVAVFVSLRAYYPDEDWSVLVGVVAFVGYVIVTVPLTRWWFTRFQRGPLEGLWAGARWGRSRTREP